MMAYSHSFWARATTKTCVRLGDVDKSFLALVDQSSEINIMSRKIYKTGSWPINVNHGWMMQAANNESGKLYGVYLAIKTKIDDVEVD